jgi:hypothetical protein
MITPVKNPVAGQLLDGQKEFSEQVNKIRYVLEQVSANLKTWRIAHTDCRRPRRLPRNHLSRRHTALLRSHVNNPRGAPQVNHPRAASVLCRAWS